MTEKHLFALYINNQSLELSTLSPGQEVTLGDDDLVHRLATILRLEPGDSVQIFNDTHSALVTVASLAARKKGTMRGIIQDIKQHQPLQPRINLYVGLIKKETFEDIAYYAAQMGATSITPLITAKVQRSWHGEKEVVRLRKAMIAGCEQAKQFVVPALNEPVELMCPVRSNGSTSSPRASLLNSNHGSERDLLSQDQHTPNTALVLPCPPKPCAKAGSLSKDMSANAQSPTIYFEATGKPFMDCLTAVTHHKPTSLSLFIGPEGGFATQEQQLMLNSGFECYALTPTILRSQEAVAVALGSLRAIARY